MKDCAEVGAPINVNLDKCYQKDTDCQSLKQGYCELENDFLIARIQGNITAHDCQVFSYLMLIKMKVLLNNIFPEYLPRNP